MSGFFRKIHRLGVPATVVFLAFAGWHAPAPSSASATENATVSASAEDRFSIEKNFGATTAYFSISSDEPASASLAAEVAREIEMYFIRSREVWGKIRVAPEARIRVELFSEAEIFRFSRDGNGRLTLFCGGNFSSSASGEARLRERLVEALLTQLFLADAGAKGEGGARRVPAWLVCAVAEESRIGSSVGRQIFLRKISATVEPISPLVLLAAGEDSFSREQFKINAVWFLRAVGKHAPRFVSAEENARERLIASAFPQFFRKEKPTAENIGVHWATRFRALISSEPTGVDLPEESAKFFDEAMLFRIASPSGSSSGGNDEARVLGADLVRGRLDAEIRQLVAERMALFVAHFRKVNPVWHNAFAEYGVFLEMFGNPDVSDETLLAQWSKAVFARSRALELQREVKAALHSTAE